jgi:hypothetical protein
MIGRESPCNLLRASAICIASLMRTLMFFAGKNHEDPSQIILMQVLAEALKDWPKLSVILEIHACTAKGHDVRAAH